MKTRSKILLLLAVILAGVGLGLLAAAGPAPYEKAVDDATSNCVAITATSAQFTVPSAYRGQWFWIVAIENSAFLKGGSDPSIASIAAGNFAFVAPDSAPLMMRLSSAKVAVIGRSAAGFVCFIPQKVT